MVSIRSSKTLEERDEHKTDVASVVFCADLCDRFCEPLRGLRADLQDTPCRSHDRAKSKPVRLNHHVVVVRDGSGLAQDGHRVDQGKVAEC